MHSDLTGPDWVSKAWAIDAAYEADEKGALATAKRRNGKADLDKILGILQQDPCVFVAKASEDYRYRYRYHEDQKLRSAPKDETMCRPPEARERTRDVPLSSPEDDGLYRGFIVGESFTATGHAEACIALLRFYSAGWIDCDLRWRHAFKDEEDKVEWSSDAMADPEVYQALMKIMRACTKATLKVATGAWFDLMKQRTLGKCLEWSLEQWFDSMAIAFAQFSWKNSDLHYCDNCGYLQRPPTPATKLQCGIPAAKGIEMTALARHFFAVQRHHDQTCPRCRQAPMSYRWNDRLPIHLAIHCESGTIPDDDLDIPPRDSSDPGPNEAAVGKFQCQYLTSDKSRRSYVTQTLPYNTISAVIAKDEDGRSRAWVFLHGLNEDGRMLTETFGKQFAPMIYWTDVREKLRDKVELVLFGNG